MIIKGHKGSEQEKITFHCKAKGVETEMSGFLSRKTRERISCAMNFITWEFRVVFSPFSIWDSLEHNNVVLNCYILFKQKMEA